MDVLLHATFEALLEGLEQRGSELRPERRLAFVARLVADVADTVHVAHEACGDDRPPHPIVAPDNLVARWNGCASLVHFDPDREVDLTTGRKRLAYVAPETLSGSLADRRSDVWSLGVVLWEAVTGQRLFLRSGVHDTLFAVADDAVLPPSYVERTIPRAFDAIVLRALAREPSERYGTALELAHALRAFVAEHGERMQAPDVAAILRELIPAAPEPEAPEPPVPSSAPATRRFSLPAIAVLQPVSRARLFVHECATALRSRPVIGAMALGLILGLFGTFVAIQLEQRAIDAATLPPTETLEGVPQTIAVPDEAPTGVPDTLALPPDD